MVQKKFTTVSGVANAIGDKNKEALQMLDFLDQFHPNLALDYDFIMQCVEDFRKKPNDGLIPYALNWSEYEIVRSAIDNAYFPADSELPILGHNYAKALAIELLPKFKHDIFDKYIAEDTNPVAFSAEPEYDEMRAELEKQISKLGIEIRNRNPKVMPLANRVTQFAKILSTEEDDVEESPLGAFRRELKEKFELPQPAKDNDLPF
jgi:hypothetical protein